MRTEKTFATCFFVTWALLRKLFHFKNNMNKLASYLLARLGEASTYRGIFALLTAFGIAMKPEQAAAITSVGLALIGAINVFKRDAAKLIPLLLAVLLLPSCGTLPSGEKTFLGITSAGWLNVGKEAAIAAAPVALSERAKFSAKQPTNILP
jgi:hypothetical protein